MKQKEFVKKILEIGKTESCTSKDISFFGKYLPITANVELLEYLRRECKISTYHVPRRDIFNIEYKKNAHPLTNIQKEKILFLTHLIKGCHLIEIKHGGFGSTTCVYNLFSSLFEIDFNKATSLYDWIASNGGNYYIDSGSSFKINKFNEQIAEKKRLEILLNDQRIHNEVVSRNKRNKKLHEEESLKAEKKYIECSKKLQEMNDKQLIEFFNKDVNNNGWTSERARYHRALHKEFSDRGFDFSDIGNKNRLSFAKPIKLIRKKIVTKK
jgi:hypothetical protein